MRDYNIIYKDPHNNMNSEWCRCWIGIPAKESVLTGVKFSFYMPCLVLTSKLMVQVRGLKSILFLLIMYSLATSRDSVSGYLDDLTA